MNNDELLVKLIVLINKVEESYIDIIDEIDVYYINYLCNFLNENFTNDNLSFELLEKINMINTDVFTNEKYFNDFYRYNYIRLVIAEYKKHHRCNKKLLFNKNLILKYIDKCYKLINYVELTKEDICLYIKENEEVLYLLDSKYIDKEILIKSLKNNKKVALILDEEECYLIRECYLKDKEIYNLYIDNIIKLLKEDIKIFPYLSTIARNDNKVKKEISKMDKRYLLFCDEGNDKSELD